MTGEFYSKHFNLEKVSDGVYAAIAKAGGGAVGNAGFIDLGDQIIVFDTFNTPQAAEDLKRAVEKESSLPVTWVVNSHYHGDHIRGNQVFKSSTIISSQVTFEKMRDIHPSRIEQQKREIKGLSDYIHSLKDQLRKEDDRELEQKISFLSEVATSLPILELTLPQQTFKEEKTVNGTKRSAKLFTLGGGHSYCDSMLFIPEEKVIFMGDLLFVQTHPSFFNESAPKQWVNILKSVEGLDFEIAIPGHGPVGTKKDISGLIDYIRDSSKLVETSNHLEEMAIPDKYQHWSSSEMYQQNLQKLKELSGRG